MKRKNRFKGARKTPTKSKQEIYQPLTKNVCFSTWSSMYIIIHLSQWTDVNVCLYHQQTQLLSICMCFFLYCMWIVRNLSIQFVICPKLIIKCKRKRRLLHFLAQGRKYEAHSDITRLLISLYLQVFRLTI